MDDRIRNAKMIVVSSNWNAKMIVVSSNNEVGSSGEFGGPVVGAIINVGEVVELTEKGLAEMASQHLDAPVEGLEVTIPHPYDDSYYGMVEDPNSAIGGLCHFMAIDLGL